MADTGEIIIKGGSTEILFDPDLFKKGSDPGSHKHPTMKIRQIIFEGKTYDYPGGFKGEIRLICKA